MTTPLVAPPFGRDTSCTDQVYYGRIVTGPTLLAEAAYRRLTTDRGSLEDVTNPEAAADYGLNITKLLNHGITPIQQGAVEAQIASELQKDPRVSSARVTITKVGAIEWDIAITIYDLDGVQADLALNVNDVTVTLLGGAT